MRIVLDTNIWVSGLLWKGLPWRLLRLAEQQKIELCAAAPILTELYEVLSYDRLQPRLQQLSLTREELFPYVLNQSRPAIKEQYAPKAKCADLVGPRPCRIFL